MYICPQCGNDLKRVRYNPDTMLNRDQFFSQVAGDYYCDHCKSDEAKSGHLYFWESSLKDGADVRAWRENVNAQLAAAEARAAKAEGAWAALRETVDASITFASRGVKVVEPGSVHEWSYRSSRMAFEAVARTMDRLDVKAVRVVVPSKKLLEIVVCHVGCLSTIKAADTVDLLSAFIEMEGEVFYLVGVRDGE